MKRSIRLGLYVISGVILASVLVCCVNFTRQAEFSISSAAGNTTLNLYISRLGLNTNLHGGNSDSYTFVFPGGLTVIKGDQITKYFVNYKETPADFSAMGEIDLSKDSAGCKVVLRLVGRDGQVFPWNGTHRMTNCGL